MVSSAATVPQAPTSASVNKQTNKSTVGVSGENNSEWDSDDDSPNDGEASSAGPSEEVLPPRTPEPGSEFEPFSSGDEEESDFSLGESYAKVFIFKPLQ